MNQTRSVAHKNSYLGAEWGKHGRLLDNTELTRSRKGIFTSKKSDETRAREASEARYNRKARVCPDCHELPSMTGECSC